MNMGKSKKIIQKVKNFYKRWNINLEEKRRFNNFKNRALSTIDTVIGELFLKNKSLENKYFKIVGIHIPQTKVIIGGNPRLFDISESAIPHIVRFEDSLVYKTLLKEKSFDTFILYLQSLFWLEDIDTEIKEKLYTNFKEDIELSLLDINIQKRDNDMIFYPKGAKLLDNLLIDDVLNWLGNYPKVYKGFSSALKQYKDKESSRNILDNLRFSLEQLFKKILNNNKPLEKQGKNLLKFLKDKNVNQEIINMYNTLITHYVKYQNENVKHNENERLSDKEIEFIIYLTGTFMRFLIRANTKE